MSVEDIGKYLRMVVSGAGDTITQELIYLGAGKMFSQEPLPEAELDALVKTLCIGYGYKPGECFMNAGRITLETDLPFCEGYAMGPWPVLHGWNEYKGRAIDVTWPIAWTPRMAYRRAKTPQEIKERIKFNIATCTYFGIATPPSIARLHFTKNLTWAPVFDYKFLRHAIKGSKYASMMVSGEKHGYKNPSAGRSPRLQKNPVSRMARRAAAQRADVQREHPGS